MDIIVHDTVLPFWKKKAENTVDLNSSKLSENTVDYGENMANFLRIGMLQ